LTFLKNTILNIECLQMSAFLLKVKIDGFADQPLRAAVAQFTGADDIASASDTRVERVALLRW